jgi:uncharacterized membrane protein YciS (DUF1049 family)
MRRVAAPASVERGFRRFATEPDPLSVARGGAGVNTVQIASVMMLASGALALLVLFALFYVTGMALGAILIPLVILAALVVVIYGAVKMRRRAP